MNSKNCYPARDPTRTRLDTRGVPSVCDETDVAIPDAPCEVVSETPHKKIQERPRRRRQADAREAVTFPLPRVFERWGKMRVARMAVLCVLIGLGAGILLLPILQSERGDNGGTDHLGGGLPSGGGQPPVGGPITTESHPQTETETQAESEAEIETERETSPVVMSPVEEDSATESEMENDAEIETETEFATETETREIESESESETETETETETMPSGAYVVVRQDLSEPNRSVGYIQCTANQLPASIPGEGTRLWSTVAAPTVLLVHSHPYEGYHDGKDWYDPATGPFAQTDALGTSDGVVGLGVELTGILREAGVNVIHLRVPIGAGESTSDIYNRTEEAVRYYCEMYPEIGLVIDLRRSAELTDQGEILRTSGNYEGEDCAQVRLSVSGDRATERVSLDIAVAVSLRRALWAEEQSISRPVLVKGGSGMAGELSRVAILTIDLGSAGNSFQEAQHLLAPLGDAIADLVLAP